MSTVKSEEIAARLTGWLRTQLPDADDVRVEGLDRIEFGHSAEMMVMDVAWRLGATEHREEVVARLRPPAPGLLEPYDLQRQYDVLRALEPTDVRAPRALWMEGSGDVLGRPFYVMERLVGEVFGERTMPAALASSPERVRRMCESLIEQIAAIHQVDRHAVGLAGLGDGRDFLDREIERWAGEMRRVQLGPLPALERLVAALRENQPEPCPAVTLVHGDTKPGNFAFVGSEVSAVYDWEMVDVGDPLADIGWAELLWISPTFTSHPAAPTTDELVAYYEDLTGIAVRHREWYRAFQGLKLTVIMLLGAMLVERGYSDDHRFVEMGAVIPFVTQMALAELGIDEQLESGPVAVSKARAQAIKERLDPASNRSS